MEIGHFFRYVPAQMRHYYYLILRPIEIFKANVNQNVSNSAPGLTQQLAVEAPKLTFDDVNSPLNMAQPNGLFKDPTSPGQEKPPATRLSSSPVVRNGGQCPPRKASSVFLTYRQHSSPPIPPLNNKHGRLR